LSSINKNAIAANPVEMQEIDKIFLNIRKEIQEIHQIFGVKTAA